MKRILFISDLHLPIGPSEHLRPELRKNLRWLSRIGSSVMDKYESRLRNDAIAVQDLTRRWLDEYDHNFDLVINGGDNAFPLSRHEDRMNASRIVWSKQLATYGEDKFIALTGNHELGHGYDPETHAYSGLLDLRNELFTTEINRFGFGYKIVNGSILLALDSELAFLGLRNPAAPRVGEMLVRMTSMIVEAAQLHRPMIVVTHNTTRMVNWLKRNNLWHLLVQNNRRPIFFGGHYHMPLQLARSDYDLYWCGGASFPEPFLKLVTSLPISGILENNPGGLEAILNDDGIDARICDFTKPLTQTVPRRHLIPAA